MSSSSSIFILVLSVFFNRYAQAFCPKLDTTLLHLNRHHKENLDSCRLIGQCHRLFVQNETILLLYDPTQQLIFNITRPVDLHLAYYPNNRSIQINHQMEYFLSPCPTPHHHHPHHHHDYQREKRNTESKSVVLTFNSSSYIIYHSSTTFDYPLRISLRFRTLGRITNGVLLAFAHRSSNIVPYIILEHSNGKVEVTMLQIDERKALSTVTTIQSGKNINNDHWHWLQFEIDDNGIFSLTVDDDSRTSQIPTYVIQGWNINTLLIGDTRRLSSDLFQPFLGYMTDLVFNDEHLFTRFRSDKDRSKISKFESTSENIFVGYRVAFFNLLTIETATSYIAFSERETQNKNHGKLDIYFLFRSYVPDGIILYRYAQGLNEYFAIGLRAGILAVFIDFGFGKRQIVSDESSKLADGKWHEVRVTRLGTDKIELIVDNRVNRSTLSANGIRNAVSLQPVLYIGGIPNSNNINLTGSGLNAQGFQGCLASFIVDGKVLDYQRALVLNGQVKMNVCSADRSMMHIEDLNKLCYDFTCLHSGLCSTDGNHAPKCDCLETGYTGERCDKLPRGFYFGRYHSIGVVEYLFEQSKQTESDTIVFGLQTQSLSAQIFRLESDRNFYTLDYEIVRGRSYLKLQFADKQADVYSAVAHITDGMYHVIKIIRRSSSLEFYVDGTRMKLEGGTKTARAPEQRLTLTQRRLKIGNFKNISQWNGIIAGFSFNRQSVFDHPSNTLILFNDVKEVFPDERTGLFTLIESYHTATAIISTTVAVPSISSTSAPMTTASMSTILSNISRLSPFPQIDHLYQEVPLTTTPSILTKSTFVSRLSFDWFYTYMKQIGFRGLVVICIISISILLLLLSIIFYLHCKHRQAVDTLNYPYPHSNGKSYAHIKRTSKRPCSKLFQYFHSTPPKSSSFRLTKNGSVSRLNSGDSYHLISSIQESQKEKHRNPRPSPPTTLYHQVNRVILPKEEAVQSNGTIRSTRKDFDPLTRQTYSAVYSCDLAANFDFDQENHSTMKMGTQRRRSLVKTNPGSLSGMVYLFMKNLVDCFALQIHRTNLLATADDNRLQLCHAHSGHFHSQLPVNSLGSCHHLLYSYQDQYLIGLFYEVTSNVNPYAVKIWSTDDYTIRTNLHPIKCSIALPSRHSSILYMAGKQKYGRGISLGLLDLESCNLARELKSDPDTSIGDEIKRILFSQNEIYVLVACTEHTNTCTCFVVFKLETPSMINDDFSPSILGSMSNCTMILTRFDCDPDRTFSIVDSNRNGDLYMLTVLRSNQLIVWQLTDGEILLSYDLPLEDPSTAILDCQMHDNRLLLLFQGGLLQIWDITVPIGHFTLISSMTDAMIHCTSWLNTEHFLSMDLDGQRLRTWNLQRKEAIHQCLSLSSRIQTLHVYPLSKKDQRDEYLIVGLSMNERSLVMFECTIPSTLTSISSPISNSHSIVHC